MGVRKEPHLRIMREMVPRRQKILLFVPTLGGGGAERVFSTLLRHLGRDQFELHLALLNTQGEYMSEVPDDVVVHDLKHSRVRYALLGLVQLIHSVRPTAVLSTLSECNFILTLSRPFLPKGTRVLVRESQLPGASLLAMSTPRRLLYRHWVFNRLYRNASKIVCLHDGMIGEFAVQFKLPSNKLVRIYNPVDSERVNSLSQIRADPYSGPGPQLVTVGRLSWEKGLDVLIRAMPRVREVFPHVNLAILGQGALREQLIELAHNLSLNGTIEFLGFQQNPWPFIRYADLFVLPSRSEGLPNALLEAMALQKEVVATDCPGALRELKALNPALTLVPAEEPEALAATIISKCKTRVQNGPGMEHLWSLEPFSLTEVVGQYCRLLLDHS